MKVLKEEKIIKDGRNIFTLKKEIDDTGIKDIRNRFRFKKKHKVIIDRTLRDIRNVFKHEVEEKSYYKPVRVSNFWSNNYIEYESNGDRNKTLSVEEYLIKIRPYVKNIINNLENAYTWKIRLTLANNFISSVDNDEEHVIHSKSNNMENTIKDEEDEVIKELFDPLKIGIKLIWDQ